MRRTLRGALLLLCCAGCLGRESAATTESAWSVDTVPFLEIGDSVLGAEPVLLYPAGATILGSGQVVIADRFAPGVRFFDPSGRLIRTVGRAGQGPGEFVAPAWLGRCAEDEVHVYDYMRRRMTVVDETGGITREYVPDGQASMFRCDRAGRFAVFGEAMNMPRSLSEMRDLSLRLRAPLWLSNAAGANLGGVGVFALGENRTLGKVTQYAISGDRILLGTADSTSIEVYDASGLVVSVLKPSATPRVPTAENYERAIEAQVDVFDNPRMREQSAELIRQMYPPPDYLPIYTGLLVDPHDIPWVVLSAPGDGETRLQAVTEAGVLADLVIPRSLTVFEVGSDYVLGFTKGEFDLPRVLAYRLFRPTS